jgi:uncharacterized protein (DUF2235 family)
MLAEMSLPVPTPVSFTPAIDCHIQSQIRANQPHPNKKKIFIFCDGTGNEFIDARGDKDNGNSNVVKLYTTLRVNNEQVAYYHPGVGTMGDPSIRHAIPRFWSKVKGLAFGNGFTANVLDAYRYLMEVYNDGDDIYIFGFSRGAYTARALAGMLHGYGLLCRGNEGHLLYAWNMFRDAVAGKREMLKKPLHARGANSHTIQRDSAFAQTYSRTVRIRFMGLWDTVASVGWIYEPVRLLSMAQNPIIQVGRHAVSIDERRAYYRDNLWGPPVHINDPEWPEELRNQGIKQDLAQVWFPGVHSDVGGSYPQDEAAPANEALRWMIGELQNHGAELCQERIDMVLGKPTGIGDLDKIYTPPPSPDHCIHQSLKGFWWVLQLFPQQYYDKEDETIQWRVPYDTPRAIPKGAIIHGSAVRRMSSTVLGEEPYIPRNLTLDRLHPLHPSTEVTTANLTGCFAYTPAKGKSSQSAMSGSRIPKLVLGWITFAIFWLIVLTVGWYILVAVSFLLLLVSTGITHTPGFKRAFRWGLSRLKP